MDKKRMIRRARIKFFILLGVFILLISISLYAHTNYTKFKNLDYLRYNPYAPLIFIFSYVALSFFPIPFSPATFAAAVIYPVHLAALYSFIGNMIFATLIFFIVRILGREYVNYLTKGNKKYRHFEEKFEERAFLNIFLLRLSYIIPIDIIGSLCGLSKVKFRKYFWATFLGNIILVLFQSILVRAAIKDNWVLFSIAVIGMIAMLVIPFIVIPEVRPYLTGKKIRNKID